MGIIYRYTDLQDGIIKYVGIVWAGNRTLEQRDKEHRKNDDWCKNGIWKVEFLQREINSRTDAEYLEAHYIAKFGTDNYYNKTKAGWGMSSIVDDIYEEWELYSLDETPNSNIHFTQITSVKSYIDSDGNSGFSFQCKDGRCFKYILSQTMEILVPGQPTIYAESLDFFRGMLGLAKVSLSIAQIIGAKVEYSTSEIDGSLCTVTFYLFDYIFTFQTNKTYNDELLCLIDIKSCYGSVVSIMEWLHDTATPIYIQK